MPEKRANRTSENADSSEVGLWEVIVIAAKDNSESIAQMEIHFPAQNGGSSPKSTGKNL
jgi:hypothetical protein